MKVLDTLSKINLDIFYGANVFSTNLTLRYVEYNYSNMTFYRIPTGKILIYVHHNTYIANSCSKQKC